MVAEAIQASSLNRRELMRGGERERLILSDRVVNLASQGQVRTEEDQLGREEV
jgi:hypothetical protein